MNKSTFQAESSADNSSSTLTEVAIALIPGVLCILQSYVAEKLENPILPAISLVGIFFLFLVMVALKNKQLVLWAFPLLGGILWEARLVLFYLYDGREIFVVYDVLKYLVPISTLLFLTLLYSSSREIHKVVLVIFGGLVLILAILSAFQELSPVFWKHVFWVFIQKWIILIAPFVCWSYFLARRLGLSAVALVIVCEPFWVGEYLTPEQINCANVLFPVFWNNFCQSSLYILALFVFLSLLPCLMVIWQNRLTEWKYWLLGASLFVIGFISYLAVFLNIGVDFILPDPIMWLYFLLTLWSPILISTLLVQRVSSK